MFVGGACVPLVCGSGCAKWLQGGECLWGAHVSPWCVEVDVPSGFRGECMPGSQRFPGVRGVFAEEQVLQFCV